MAALSPKELAQMIANAERIEQSREEANTVDGEYHYDDRQTTQPPSFHHPEIQWLYSHGFNIPEEKLQTILALPRPTLTEDLSKVMLDILYRLNYFGEQDWTPETHSFASHALLLMAELKAGECLPAVLETLRQDTDFQEFWFADWLDDTYGRYFWSVADRQFTVLRNFLIEPNVNTYAKAVVSSAYCQWALAQPERRQIALAWYKEVFEYLIRHADNPDLLDTDLMGFLISEISDLQLHELLPLVAEAFEQGLVTDMIVGNYADVEQKMNDPEPDDRRFAWRTLKEQYAYLDNPQPYHEAKLKELDSKLAAAAPPAVPKLATSTPFYESSEPYRVEPKLGRNEKVSVRYNDGKVIYDVKYKKVEADLNAGKCTLL
ncbi:hypothetical protein GCM10023189_01940 [Nibrella saemangeumensis]|uniref:PRTRC system protein F n=1 Tax=Nibrella saemangeumensis TaxID=1084526 RepID=A0ABP8MBD2_9BACT